MSAIASNSADEDEDEEEGAVERYGLSQDPAWIAGNASLNPAQDELAVRLTATILAPAPRGIALLAGSAMLEQPVAEQAATLLRDGAAVDAQLGAASGPLPSSIATALLTHLRNKALRSSMWPARVPPGIKGLGTREAGNETAIVAGVLDKLLRDGSPVTSATLGVAFLAGDDGMRLPPATADETSAWVRAALDRWQAAMKDEKESIEAALLAVQRGGAAAAAEAGVAWPFPADLVGGAAASLGNKPQGVSDAHWAMAQEATMLSAEEHRLQRLLGDRLQRLMNGLANATEAAATAQSLAEAAADAARKRIAAAGSSAA